MRLLASLLLGVGIGAAGTLVGLKAMGVPLESGFNSPAFRKFLTAYTDLRNKYYQPESDQALLNGAIDGMTKSLNDPFTNYFPPADATQFRNMLSGSYVGIGVMIEQVDHQTVVHSVMKNAPAEKAGIRPQDVIVKVDGKSVEGMSLEAVSQLIMGPKGTPVTLTIKRPSAPDQLLNIRIVRDQVTKQTVFSKMLDDHVGYLQITVVADNTAEEVKQHLADLTRSGARSVIVDLRGNPGGYLEEAVKIAGQFIPKGRVVVQTVGRNSDPNKMLSPGPGTTLPVVVLMDQNTASAAEILAAALHEDLGAPLVGTRSYGKGTMQETTSFADGSSLKYTVGKWLTPNGEWIHKKGLQPTVPVAMPDYASLHPLDSGKLPLRPDQNNSDVATAQKMLAALGYPVQRRDGYFDASTASAVKQFQSHEHLPASGIVDQKTAQQLWDVFSELLAKSDTQLQKAEQVAAERAR
jgi:carboxyl-terminal processing protease